MFEPKTKTIELEGQAVTIQEIAAGDLEEMGETAVELVAAGIAKPGVTKEQVGRWPSSIVVELAREIAEFNGFTEGNGSTPNG